MLIEVDRQATGATDLRYVVFGGEALNLTSLTPWFDRHGDESPALVKYWRYSVGFNYSFR